MSSRADFELLIPESMPKSIGYSQVATVKEGNIFFVAGQVALNKSGDVVGGDNFRAQAQQVFENLMLAIEAVGGTFNDVVKLNGYLLDFAHLVDFREIRDQFVNVTKPPVSTIVQVSRLFRPEFLIEVEAMGVVQEQIRPF
jgi:enamine deaminase RidA (YjgF/YER057c/UK114 family)